MSNVALDKRIRLAVTITALFQTWKPGFGILGSAGAVGTITLVLAFFGLMGIEETYGKDLDFLEE